MAAAARVFGMHALSKRGSPAVWFIHSIHLSESLRSPPSIVALSFVHHCQTQPGKKIVLARPNLLVTVTARVSVALPLFAGLAGAPAHT